MLAKPLALLEGINKGIAPGFNVGFEDIRNLDFHSTQGSLSINNDTDALTAPPTVTAVAYTVVTATDVFTVASTSGWFNGMAVTLNTVVTSTGISTGRVYWVGDLSGVTFKLYTNPVLDASNLVDVTGSDGSGTISSYTMSAPLDKAQHFIGTGSITRNQSFILDDAGRVWWVKNTNAALTSYLVYLGNDTLTGTGGRAIIVFSQDIVVFRESNVDRLNVSDLEGNIDLDSGTGWSYGFDTVSSIIQTRRPVMVKGDHLYFGNSGRLGSFDDDYIKDVNVLDLPPDDDVEALGELGDYVLIGGQKDLVYPWNEANAEASYRIPIILPDRKVSRIVTGNQHAFIFAGNRGRVYWTNGTSVEEYFKFPDHLAGSQEPYFTWGDAMAWRNQLYFTLTGTTNAGVALTTVSGIWAVDMPTRALRLAAIPSYGTYSGTISVLMPHTLATSPPGLAFYAGWSYNSTYGVDITAATFHTSYTAYAITPVHLISMPGSQTSLDSIKYVLDKPLASGEGVRVYYRAARSDSFTLAHTFDYATFGALQFLDATFPTSSELVTAQFKIELTGSSTSPSVREVFLT